MVDRRLGLLLMLPSLLLGSESFEQFQKQQHSDFLQEKKAFIDYQTQEDQAFSHHMDKEAKAIDDYKRQVKALWPTADLQNPKKIVNYSKDLKTQNVIDFEHNTITISHKNPAGIEDKKALLAELNQTLHQNNHDAYIHNRLEQKLRKELTPSKYVKTAKPDSIPLLSQEDINIYAVQFQQKNDVLTLTYSLPKNSTFKRSTNYLVAAKSNAQRFKLKANWLLAIMHSESSFNPMARSHVPAYGLMQIVPRTAGIDAYKFLHNKRRMLSASYLYNSQNNIEMGAAYFHILYYRYLSSVKDPTSRLYCCIAAYNTGSGNVAKSFIGSTNVKKAAKRINNMSPDAVYKHLINNLPYDETKHYLKRVNDRQLTYKEVYKL